MSRQTNFFGLNERAKQFISNNNLVKTANHENVYGMFDEIVYVLQDYFDGRYKYREYIQAEPWSSGPCIFIALWDIENNIPVKDSLWTDEEINQV